LLLALAALPACSPTPETGSPSGTGGSSATAGASGSAGAAGAAGTSGGAGGSGIGVAGSGGGTAGSSTTAGTGGAGGNAAGRGGAGGSGGSAAGRGGTSGTGGSAGTVGGGGAGGCTITATSTLGMIPTVGIVTFTTNATEIATSEIRYGLASTGPTMTAPVDLTSPTPADHRTLLLGMKGSSSYVYRVVIDSPAGTCTSQDYPIMTGTVPSNIPRPTTMIMNASAHAKGFIVTSSGTAGTGAYIFDSDGAPVWWAAGPQGTSRIQMSWDGSKMYMMSLNVQNNGAGRINVVNMDGSGVTMMANMAGSHHDMAAIPGGVATLWWNASGIDAPNSLVERMEGETSNTTVIANLNTVYNSTSFHTNSIHYYPSDDTYTLGDRNPNLYVKVSRTGQLIWQLGGTNPKDQAKLFSGVTNWVVNHGHHLLADGTIVLFNNGAMMNGQSVARVFKLNTANMTAMSTLTYNMPGVNSNVLGDAQFLPNGNLLVTYSQSGWIHEVSSTGQLIATFKGTAFGYTEYRESLYGPPPR
jgi:hypothetical protein